MEKTLLFKETAKWERLGDMHESVVSYPLESFVLMWLVLTQPI